MEFCQSLVLNEDILKLLSNDKKPIYIYEWLRFLLKIFEGAQKKDIKDNQKTICEQMMHLMVSGQYLGPCSDDLMGKVMVRFMGFIEDTFLLLEVVNKCNDMLKPSFNPQTIQSVINVSVSKLNSITSHKPVNTKLCSLYILCYIYKDLGKITGRCHEETFYNLIKLSKMVNTLSTNPSHENFIPNSKPGPGVESKEGEILASYQREEIKYTMLLTIKQLFDGLGKQIQHQIMRDIYKRISKQNYLMDYKYIGTTYFINGQVKALAAQSILSMSGHYGFVYMSEHETLLLACTKSLEHSDYFARVSISHLIAKVVFKLVFPDKKMLEEAPGGKIKPISVEDGLGTLSKMVQAKMNATLGSQSTLSSLFKSTHGSTLHTTKCFLVGISYAYVRLVKLMRSDQPSWLDNNLRSVLEHLVEIFMTGSGWCERPDDTYLLVFTSHLAGLVIRAIFRDGLSENEKILASKTLLVVVNKHISTVHNFKGSGKKATMGTIKSSLIFSTLLRELNHLLVDMGALFKSVLKEYPVPAQPWVWLSVHNPDPSVQFYSVLCLRSLCHTFPRLLQTYSKYFWALISTADCAEPGAESIRLPPKPAPPLSWGGAVLAFSATLVLNARTPCTTSTLTVSSTEIYLRVSGILDRKMAAPGDGLPLVDTTIRAAGATAKDLRSAWILLNCVALSDSRWVSAQIDKLLSLLKRHLYTNLRGSHKEDDKNTAHLNWPLLIENISGALTTIDTIVVTYPHLLSENVTSVLLQYVHSTLAFMSNSTAIVRDMSPSVKRVACLSKMKLFHVLRDMPSRCFEDHFNLLLRELIVEITQSPDSFIKSCQYPESASLFYSPNQDGTCVPLTSVSYGLIANDLGCDADTLDDLMQTYPLRTEAEDLEILVHPNLQISTHNSEVDIGHLLFRQDPQESDGPLLVPPPCTRLLNESVLLFAHVFPFAATKHKLQILSHLNETVNKVTGILGPASSPASPTSIIPSQTVILNTLQINVAAALLAAFKNQERYKLRISDHYSVLTSPASSDSVTSNLKNDSEIKKCLQDFIYNTFGSPEPLLRLLGTHLLGRLAQTERDGKFCAEVLRSCSEKLKTITDAYTRTSYSLALGILYKYVGSTFNLNTDFKSTVNLLVTLSQDSISEDVQNWAMASLHLVIDNATRHVKEYAESLLNYVVDRLLNLPQIQIELRVSVSKCIYALINSLGPEIQDNAQQMSTIRSLLFTAISILQYYHMAFVRSAAVTCLQQLHLFVPQHFQLPETIQYLIECSSDSYYPLRRASISFMKQIIQKEPLKICSIVKHLTRATHVTTSVMNHDGGRDRTSFELLAFLFHHLNREWDPETQKLTRYTILNLLSSVGSIHVTPCLHLFGQILANKISGESGTKGDEDPTTGVGTVGALSTTPYPTDEDEDTERTFSSTSSSDHPSNLKASKSTNTGGTGLYGTTTFGDGCDTLPAIGTFAWSVKVFGAECVSYLIQQQQQSAEVVHFDMKKARERQKADGNDNFLVLHLSELVRLSFICITSEHDTLKTAGLQILLDLMVAFKSTPDPDYAGHFILEQYQAQVGACLRPVFAPEHPAIGRDSRTLAKACHVCSYWVSSGIQSDTSDIKKIQQLLLSSLSKLSAGSSQVPTTASNTDAGNGPEPFSLIEKLAILQAWAEIYNVENKGKETLPTNESLNRTSINSVSASVSSDSDRAMTRSYDVDLLGTYWAMALRDYATLTLPNDYQTASTCQHVGNFYAHQNNETALPLYKEVWVSYAQALSFYILAQGDHIFADIMENGTKTTAQGVIVESVHLVLGVTLEAICNSCLDLPLPQLKACLSILRTLLTPKHLTLYIFVRNQDLGIEIIQILYKLTLAELDDSIGSAILRILAGIVVNLGAGGLPDRVDLNRVRSGRGSLLQPSIDIALSRTQNHSTVSDCGIDLPKSIFQLLIRILGKNGILVSTRNAKPTLNFSKLLICDNAEVALDILGRLPFLPAELNSGNERNATQMSALIPVCLLTTYNIYLNNCRELAMTYAKHEGSDASNASHKARIKSLICISTILDQSYTRLLPRTPAPCIASEIQASASDLDDSGPLSAADNYESRFDILNHVVACFLTNVICDTKRARKATVASVKDDAFKLSASDGVAAISAILRTLPLDDFKFPEEPIRSVARLLKEIMESPDEKDLDLFYVSAAEFLARCSRPISSIFIGELLPTILRRFGAGLASLTTPPTLKRTEMVLDVLFAVLPLSRPSHNEPYLTLLLELMGRIKVNVSHNISNGHLDHTNHRLFCRGLLSRLNNLALLYPDKVKSIMASDPDLLEILEGLAKASTEHDSHRSSASTSSDNHTSCGDGFDEMTMAQTYENDDSPTIVEGAKTLHQRGPKDAGIPQVSIKLKTDFSNFASSKK